MNRLGAIIKKSDFYVLFYFFRPSVILYLHYFFPLSREDALCVNKQIIPVINDESRAPYGTLKSITTTE